MDILTLAILSSWVSGLLVVIRNSFKIARYETELEKRNVDISAVKDMPWWKLWTNLNI